VTTLSGVDTRVLFIALVGLAALQRLAELSLAQRNLRRAMARGGREAAPGHYRWMVLLHTLWLAAGPAEVWLLGRPFVPALAAAMLALFLAAMALRYWVIATLGERWTTRIVVLPGAPPVVGGPYRYLRHPNYLAVILELLALPLIHTAWLTALLAGISNALVLKVRIAEEEKALAAVSDYGAVFADRPRLLPRP
jgi:methyltransferase